MSQRRPLIGGNWKMHKTIAETRGVLSELRAAVETIDDVDLAVAPPFTALAAAAETLVGSRIALWAQTMHEEQVGAYTGEISAVMLSDVGVRAVLLGHSERRALFGESNELVGHKLRTALAGSLEPVLCVGESEAQRLAGSTSDVVAAQLRAALEGLTETQMGSVVVAYEPVWAIGTGLTATPEQAQEVHAEIRTLLAELFGSVTAETVRIQYGGSVKPENAAELLAQPDIDGALVGGASLDARSFAGIALAVSG